MNPLAVIANLAHRTTLLGRHIGNAHGGGRDGLDRRNDLIQRAVGGLCLVGGGFGMFKLGAHAFHRFAGGLLQAPDQGLDLAGGTGSALGQGTHLFGDHGEPAAHFASAGRFDRGVEGQQVGLFGNRTDHREHASDGG
ncbi:hypothetical protein D9M70_568910 [compost metagenome]